MKRDGNGFGVASLVLGILSIILGPLFAIISLPAGIVGIVFAVIQGKRFPNKIAKAGLITNILGLVIAVLGVLLWLMYFGVFS